MDAEAKAKIAKMQLAAKKASIATTATMFSVVGLILGLIYFTVPTLVVTGVLFVGAVTYLTWLCYFEHFSD